jgi:hypothetical protein
MAEIVVPQPLRGYTDGASRVEVSGGTVGAALEELFARYPGLRAELLTDAGALRAGLHLFLGERDVLSLDGLATPLPVEARLILVLPISGG